MMKNPSYPQIEFTFPVHPEFCTIKKYDDGSGVQKYCILQDIKKDGKSIVASVIAVSGNREPLLNYLYDNGFQYSDYFGD